MPAHEPVNHTTTLPADPRSPAIARSLVRAALTEAGVEQLIDDAVLLTTELTTNAVLHAGEGLGLDIHADHTGVTVRVRDGKRGLIEPTLIRAPGLFSEGGRGLRLVDALATAWGTVHERGHKTLWFRLDAERGLAETVPVTAPRSNTISTWSTEQAVQWLAALPASHTGQLSTAELLTELLHRICEIGEADVGVLWLEPDGSSQAQAAAAVGVPAEPAEAGGGARTWTVPAGAGSGASPLLRDAGAEHTVLLAVPVALAARGWIELGFRAAAEPDSARHALLRLGLDRIGLVLDGAAVRDNDNRRRAQVSFLADASELLTASFDVDLTLALLAQLCVPRLGRWCVIHKVIGDGHPVDEQLEFTVAVHVDERAVPELEEAFLGVTGAALTDQVRRAVRTRSSSPLLGSLPGTVVPLTARRHVVGAMTVGAPLGRRHTNDELVIAEDLARRAAMVADNARLYADRDAVAQGLQRALLPPALPLGDGVEFGAEYSPAGEGNDVGGDFYDVVPLGEGRWLVAIGDVCGKGPEAASVTGLVRDVLRVLVREGRELGYALNVLNRTLLEQAHRNRFCTVAAAVATRVGRELELDLCIAGHLQPVLIPGVGDPTSIGTNGMAVGLTEPLEVARTALRLMPGDALVFFTDGVTERRAGQQLFGEERVVQALAGCRGWGARRVARALHDAVVEFGSEALRDDLAILALSNLAAR